MNRDGVATPANIREMNYAVGVPGGRNGYIPYQKYFTESEMDLGYKTMLRFAKTRGASVMPVRLELVDGKWVCPDGIEPLVVNRFEDSFSRVR